jgi:all-trans-retinol 13,14-reductase
MVITGKRYQPSYVEGKKFDVIIIGSGLSALSLGSYLSQKNQKVLLLEKHYTAGGFTHMFKRKEYLWDVGVHYVGEVHKKGKMFDRLFNHISGGKLEWAPLDEVYDHVFIGKNHYKFYAGVDKFKAELYKSFPKPEDKKAIDTYVDLCFKVNNSAQLYFLNKALPKFWRRLTRPFLGRYFRKLAKQTTLEVMNTLTSNKELQAVLVAQYGDQGLPPAQSSFVIQAMVSKHFFAGGNYPVGGSVNFAKTIIPMIENNGGEVLTHAPVKSILIENNVAVGVELENGTKIYAPKVVSSAGVHKTYLDLIDQKTPISETLKNQANSLRPSIGHICLYIGLKGNAQELELPKANYWIYPHNDYDKALEDFCQDPKADLPLTYISFPGAKDPHWRAHHPDSSTIEIITFAPWSWFEKWDETKWKKRGEDYDAFKQFLSERLLEKLYLHCPLTKGKVDYFELSTPLSTKHFCSYKKGEVYGLDHTPERFLSDWIAPETPIKNLYLTGQDVMSVGIGTSAVSGILTAGAMTKKNVLKEFL